jgi:hypothetical protein
MEAPVKHLRQFDCMKRRCWSTRHDRPAVVLQTKDGAMKWVGGGDELTREEFDAQVENHRAFIERP